jgi:hypothetical protein
MMAEVFETAAAVLAAIGGAGAIILGLSAWLGKVWADRLMQSARAQHERALEVLRTDLRRDTEAELEHLRSSLQGEMDVLLRRRQVYERIAVAMRVFLAGGKPATEADKREFLAAYDTSMLWAPDSVVNAIGRFLDANMASGRNPQNMDLQNAQKRAYTECLIEMRKDSGFPSTSVETYRVVSF